MRVVSWNMNKRGKKPGKQWTWDYLLKTLKREPDVALLQECSPIKDVEDKSIAEKCITVDVNERNRNTIYSKSGRLCSYPIYSASVGQKKIGRKKAKLPYDGGTGFNVASEEIPGFGHVYFISVYGNQTKPFWDESEPEKNIFDIRIIGLLTVYARTLREIYGARHIIIAGDFNLDPRDDTHRKYGREKYNRWSGHFADICKLGFKDCLMGKHIPTHLNNKTWRCIDHFFATEELFKRLKQPVEVAEEVIEKDISDHNPIIADFE